MRCGTWNRVKLVSQGLILALLLTAFVGCSGAAVANAKNQTHTAITLTAETYDALMTSLGALYKKQIIGNAERDKAVGYANTFREAALKIAAGVDNAEFEVQIQKMKDMIAKLKELLARAGLAENDLKAMEQMTRNMEAERGLSFAMAGGGR
jgi:hypothetical protein